MYLVYVNPLWKHMCAKGFLQKNHKYTVLFSVYTLAIQQFALQ